MELRYFVTKNLDKLICICSGIVIICLIFKFLQLPYGDYFFCISLSIEACIFLLGALKIENNTYPKNQNKNVHIYNKIEETNNVDQFLSEILKIENDLQKIKKKIKNISQEKDFQKNYQNQDILYTEEKNNQEYNKDIYQKEQEKEANIAYAEIEEINEKIKHLFIQVDKINNFLSQAKIKRKTRGRPRKYEKKFLEDF